MSNIDPRFAIPFNMDPIAKPIREHTGNDLDKNAFLSLLITQLRHQDPLNPMDDREFISQMAQFSALEQMQNLNSTFGRFQAFSMMGQLVSGVIRNPVSGSIIEVSGFVDSVEIRGSEAWLHVRAPGSEDTQLIKASDVQFAADDSMALTLDMLRRLNSNFDSGTTVNQSLAMVGRVVQAFITDANGKPTGFVEGRVQFVDFAGNFPMLAIGNERIHVGEVVSVGESNMIIGKNVGFYKDDAFVPGGTIERIHISGENAYAVISGTHHRIDRINFLTEALNLRDSQIDETVKFDGKDVRVIDVVIQNNAVWVEIQAQGETNTTRVRYAELMGIKLDEVPPDDDPDDNVADDPDKDGDTP
jgi:flagellar basal-body rod modification protein FlgD